MKKILMNLLSILLIVGFPTNSFAEDAVNLDKGAPAPYAGVLLTQKKLDSIAVELQEKDRLVLLNGSLNRSLDLSIKSNAYSEEKVSVLLEQNKALISQQSLTTLERIGWIVLGVAVTILTANVVKTTVTK